MSDAARNVIGGRYQIIASLGKGGMGLVYKAYDPVLDRTVALKKMLATVVDSDELRQRFFIEARAAARLNHPNIVTIYELEEHAGDIYIVMELLEGVSLAAFLRNPVPLSLAGYLTILAQVAEGLHYAHSRAIVHRDIKPANLVLTTNGGVKILDFGIAQLASNEITKKGAMLGTPHYMSPEQVRGEAVDARADLFALGAVAYELVTGVKAFTADNIAALLMRITEMPHTPVLDAAPGTAPALAEIVDRLLSKDRAQRPWNGEELCQALERIGEIDRSDLVAEAVRTVLGPLADETLYQPVAGEPSPVAPRSIGGLPAMPTPPSSLSSPSLPSFMPPPVGPRTPVPGTGGGSGTASGVGRTPAIGSGAGSEAAPVNPGEGGSVVWAAGTPPGAVEPPPLAERQQALPPGLAPVPLASMPAAAASAPPRADAVGAGAVGASVPQARTRRGSGVGLIAIAAVLLLAFAGTGWWAYTALRQQLAIRNTTGQASNTSATTATTATQDPAQDPGKPTTVTPSQASNQSASTAVATETPVVSTPDRPATDTPATDAPATTDKPAPHKPTTDKPATDQLASNSVPGQTDPARPQTSPMTPDTPTTPTSDVNPRTQRETTAYLQSTPTQPPTSTSTPTNPPQTAQTPQRPVPEQTPNEPKAADAPPPNAPPKTADAPTKTTTPRDPSRREAPPRDVARNDAPADPREPADVVRPPRESPRDGPREPTRREQEPETRQPLDPGSIAAFQSQGRSSPSSSVYAESPSLAAAVARITYTLEAYSDAIAQRDLDALRDVRSPVTAAETALLKEADTSVRFTNLDVNVSGTDGFVRCRRAIVSAGRTRSSGLVEVHLTRRPSGWIITDIR